MEGVLNYLPCIAQILIGFFFVFFGGWNLYHWTPTLAVMEQKKLPLPSFLLGLGIFTQSICGLMIIFGVYVKLAALVLIPFTIIVVNIFHAFWKFEGELWQLNFVIYLTHMTSTLGALILLMNNIIPNHSLINLLTR